MSEFSFNPHVGRQNISGVKAAGQNGAATFDTGAKSVVDFGNVCGGDTVSVNHFASMTSCKDTPETVDCKALIARIAQEGGSLKAPENEFLKGPHPEYAFV